MNKNVKKFFLAKFMNNNIVVCMDTLLAYIVSGVCLQIKSLLTADQKVIFVKN
jgi:hypothetical protein